MSGDVETLRSINIEIGNAETKGDAAQADRYLAPKLAFRRADGKTFDGRAEFLSKVAASPERETEIETVSVYGNRAIVTCIVTLKTDLGEKKFHNIRLFVRHESKWRLLGWANEPM